jgi:hypothetical protein
MLLKQIQQNNKTSKIMFINLLYEFQTRAEFSVLRAGFSVFKNRSKTKEFSVSIVEFSKK